MSARNLSLPLVGREETLSCSAVSTGESGIILPRGPIVYRPGPFAPSVRKMSPRYKNLLDTVRIDSFCPVTIVMSLIAIIQKLDESYVGK